MTGLVQGTTVQGYRFGTPVPISTGWCHGSITHDLDLVGVRGILVVRRFAIGVRGGKPYGWGQEAGQELNIMAGYF